MNAVLSLWNSLPAEEAAQQILPCCGSRSWARAMASARPISDLSELSEASDRIWRALPVLDWLEAFSSHPRIGESQAASPADGQSASWSVGEQRAVTDSAQELKLALAEANRLYEQRFGRIFLVCATGKSAPEILEILRRRLQNDEASELQAAAEEQRRIVRIRLKKWLGDHGGT
jgi:2-oxo-4-hydroxy-4-carboxy-5-ureidoimidazoline decarboxylase